MLRQWLCKADDIVTYMLHYIYRSASYVKAVLTTTLLQSDLPRHPEQFLCATFCSKHASIVLMLIAYAHMLCALVNLHCVFGTIQAACKH